MSDETKRMTRSLARLRSEDDADIDGATHTTPAPHPCAVLAIEETSEKGEGPQLVESHEFCVRVLTSYELTLVPGPETLQ